MKMKKLLSLLFLTIFITPSLGINYALAFSTLDLNSEEETILARERKKRSGGSRDRSSNRDRDRSREKRNIDRNSLGTSGSGRIDRDKDKNRDRDRDRDRDRNVERNRTRIDNNRNNINIDNSRRNSNRINRNIVNTGNIVVNPRPNWGGWGWNRGNPWAPNYDYWGGGFWGGFAVGAFTTAVTGAIINSNDDPTYVVIQQDTPGYYLFDSYGLTQIQCDTSLDLVFIYGPQNTLMCATPNSVVIAGYYDVDPEDLVLILRD